MSYKVDGRGSKPQRLLYDWLHELYPAVRIIYEQPLYQLGQRIDIYIPNLGIAIEYNGEAHYNFISHFHKSIEDFEYGLKLDKQKREYLYCYGIKCVDIPFDKMPKTKEEFKEIIDSTPYPEDIEFKPLPENEKAEEFKAKVKESTKKNFVKREEDPQDRKERLKKEKEMRKEKYLKYKERIKK